MSAALIERLCERTVPPSETVVPRARQLDPPAIVLRQRGHAGIDHVSVQAECTMCHSDDDVRFFYYNYRRDRKTRTPIVDVQWSVGAIAAS